MAESARLWRAPAPTADNLEELANQRGYPDLQRAVRDWIESLLPASKQVLDAQLPLVEAKVKADLSQAGVLLEQDDDGPTFKAGSVSGVDWSRPAEAPDMLAVTVGARVPCGSDDVVYVYDYSQGAPRRVLETRSHDGWLGSVSDVLFSRLDADGGRLILTVGSAVQCWSTWMSLSYNLFRLNATADLAAPILSDAHSFWLRARPVDVRLQPDDLLIELWDHSIDFLIHHRTHILHYKVTGSAVERVDPVALIPRDFVDEWLTRPWGEMESRSATGEKDAFKKWHDFFGDFASGQFTFVQPCAEKPGQWQLGMSLGWVGGKELPEGLDVFFMVRQLEPHRFEMTGISLKRQEGCPGDSPADMESPSLFPPSGDK